MTEVRCRAWTRSIRMGFQRKPQCHKQHICICLLYQYNLEIQAGAAETRIAAHRPLAVMRSTTRKTTGPSLRMAPIFGAPGMGNN